MHAVGMALTERFKLRIRCQQQCGKKGATLLSLFMEAFGLEVEEDLATLACQYWVEGVWIGKTAS